MRIEKKCWSEFFEKILKGEKTFDVRLADFDCAPGDILVLKEYNPKTRQYTGRVIEKKVTYSTKTKELKFWPKEDIDKKGFQIISFS